MRNRVAPLGRMALLAMLAVAAHQAAAQPAAGQGAVGVPAPRPRAEPGAAAPDALANEPVPADEAQATEQQAQPADERAEPEDAVVEDPQGEAATGEAGAQSRIQLLGEEGAQLYAVEHADSWSLHVESVPVQVIFSLWHSIGGPGLASKQPLEFAFTMSVHEQTAERVVARVLDGYSYTLFYEGGRLAEVQVVGGPPPGEQKTPRLVESRGQWTNEEMTLLAAGQQAPAGK